MKDGSILTCSWFVLIPVGPHESASFSMKFASKSFSMDLSTRLQGIISQTGEASSVKQMDEVDRII